MIKKNLFFGAVGLALGLIIGFFWANKINRSAIPQTPVAQTDMDADMAQFANPQVQNASVKGSQTRGAAMPEVTETLQRAKNEPGNFDAQIKAGDMYTKIQKFDTAIEYYQKANQIKPDDYGLIVKIGNTFFDAKNFESAEKWYEKALAIKPDDKGVRTDFGITFIECDSPNLERAVQEFQTALQQDSKYEPAIYNLGVAYFKKGENEKAKESLKQLEAVNRQGDLAGKLKQILSKNQSN